MRRKITPEKYQMWGMIAISIGLIIAALLISYPSFTKPQNQRTVSVSGEAKVEALPDTYEISFHIAGRGNDIKTAKIPVLEKSNKIIRICNKYNTSLKTTDFHVSKERVLNRNMTGYNFLGWVVRESFLVKLYNSSEMENLTNDLINLGVSIDNTNSYVDNKSKYKLEAINKAMADAYNKAQAATYASGMRITQPKSISLNYYWTPVYRTMLTGNTADEKINIPTGPTYITADVNVVYEME